MVNKTSSFAGRCGTVALFLLFATQLYGQQNSNPIDFPVTRDSQRLEMVVNTSRILTLEKEVPRAMVNNPDVVRVVPLSPNKVQLSAIKAGVTQVNLWDEDGRNKI